VNRNNPKPWLILSREQLFTAGSNHVSGKRMKRGRVPEKMRIPTGRVRRFEMGRGKFFLNTKMWLKFCVANHIAKRHIPYYLRVLKNKGK